MTEQRKAIVPKAKLISEYLKLIIDDANRARKTDSKFIIPNYQRRYSWNISTCDKLYHDFKEYIEQQQYDEDEAPYFFGTVIVNCQGNHFSIIDGQQRTITFILFFKAALLLVNELINNNKNTNEPDTKKTILNLKGVRRELIDILYVALTEAEKESFIDDWNNTIKPIILQNNSINELIEYQDELKTILCLESFDSKHVPKGIAINTKAKKDETRFSPYFNNFKFFYNTLKTDYADLLKLYTFVNTLLNKCQLIEIRTWEEEQAIQMFNSLNSTGMPLTDADIISALLYSKVDDTKKKDEFNSQWKEFVNDVNSLGKKDVTTIDAILQQYMYIERAKNGKSEETTPSVRNFYTKFNEYLLEDPFALTQSFQKITDIWAIVSDTTIGKILLKFNSNIRFYLIAYLFRFNANLREPSEIENELPAISECLLRLFTILELSDEVYSSKNFKSFLLKEIKEIVNPEVNIKSIIEHIDIKIKKTWRIEDLYQRLTDYDKSALVYLHEYLYWKDNHANAEFKLDTTANIEHIMPASGRDINTVIKQTKLNPENFYAHVNKLGNKILLEENINKSIGNNWFATKKNNSINGKYQKGYIDSKYFIAQDLVGYESDFWTIQDIDKATKNAALRILKFVFNNPEIILEELNKQSLDV